jgi:hypothetical protein
MAGDSYIKACPCSHYMRNGDGVYEKIEAKNENFEVDEMVYTTLPDRFFHSEDGCTREALEVHDAFFKSNKDYDGYRAFGIKQMKYDLCCQYENFGSEEAFGRQVIHAIVYALAHGKEPDRLWKKVFCDARLSVKRFLYTQSVHPEHKDHVELVLIALCVLENAMQFVVMGLGFSLGGEEEGKTS